jgi:glycosyltransferase involved in cell wall biosynthesis
MPLPDISIVTPCLNPGALLKLCCASVRDQTGLAVEHIVVDGGSTDGTVEWLKLQSGLVWISEPDAGMYDAINKGLRVARGRLVAYLNCDEQYLPDALATVVRMFDGTDVDVLLGDVVIVDALGQYLCSRQVLSPLFYHTMLCELGTLSAGVFFRSDLLARFQAWFDPSWRAAGDAVWMLHLLRQRVKMKVLRQYVATFTDHGANLALSGRARQESIILSKQAPMWARSLTSGWRMLHRVRRALHGLYIVPPFAYDLYTLESPDQRRRVNVVHSTYRWQSRLAGGCI